MIEGNLGFWFGFLVWGLEGGVRGGRGFENGRWEMGDGRWEMGDGGEGIFGFGAFGGRLLVCIVLFIPIIIK